MLLLRNIQCSVRDPGLEAPKVLVAQIRLGTCTDLVPRSRTDKTDTRSVLLCTESVFLRRHMSRISLREEAIGYTGVTCRSWSTYPAPGCPRENRKIAQPKGSPECRSKLVQKW